MKVKLGEIYNSVNVLSKLLDTEIPVSVSYKLMKLVNTLNSELKTVEEQRIKLVKKYSDTSTEESTVKDESKDAFLKDFSELLAQEIEIDWVALSLKTLDNSVKLSVNDLTKIQYLFAE